MCGIFGYWDRGGRTLHDAVLVDMARKLVHRGPDDEGIRHRPGRGTAVGCRRLAIIDLASGHQPFVSDDGLPKPRPPRAPRPGAAPGQSNGVDRRPRGGLSVTWLEVRGPAKVTFETMPVVDGKSITTAHFIEPGTYQLRATASDGALSTRADVTVTVKR